MFRSQEVIVEYKLSLQRKVYLSGITIIIIASRLLPFRGHPAVGFGPKLEEMNPRTFPDLPIRPRTLDFDQTTSRIKKNTIQQKHWKIKTSNNQCFWIFVPLTIAGHWIATGQCFGNFIGKILYKNLDLKEGGYRGRGGGAPLVPPPFKIQIFIWDFPHESSGGRPVAFQWPVLLNTLDAVDKSSPLAILHFVRAWYPT